MAQSRVGLMQAVTRLRRFSCVATEVCGMRSIECCCSVEFVEFLRKSGRCDLEWGLSSFVKCPKLYSDKVP